MSLIRNIFRKPELVDYSAVGTDIHSHFLPGIDDGCKTEGESLHVLKRMCESGFSKIYCTPHVQFEYFRNSRDTIFQAFEKLQKRAFTEIPHLELQVGAEYLIDEGFGEQIAKGLIPYGSSNFVLVEISYFSPHPKFKNLLQDVMMKGFTPVLAHPERYVYWPVNEKIFEELHAAGILFQVNIPSLCGYYGPEVRNRAFDLISKGFVSLAGSDVHNDRYFNAILDGLKNNRLQSVLKSGVFKNSELFG